MFTNPDALASSYQDPTEVNPFDADMPEFKAPAAYVPKRLAGKYIFNRTSRWAYRAIRRYWDQSPIPLGFFEELAYYARETNKRLPEPLEDQQVTKIALDIADWVGYHYTKESYSERQRRVAQRSGEARRREADALNEEIVELREGGYSWAEVADELGMTVGAAKMVHKRAEVRRNGNALDQTLD